MDTPKMAADTLHRPVLPAAVASDRAPARPSLAEVYDAEFDYVYRCLRSLGLRGALLDDAVQDVFMVVQEKLESFDGRAQLRTWLYAITLRIARRYRSRYAQDAQRFVAVEPPAIASTDAALERKQGLELAQRALLALDHDKREVFVLAEIEELPAPQIARIVGLPLNTVYSRLRAARSAFEAQVARLRRRGVER